MSSHELPISIWRARHTLVTIYCSTGLYASGPFHYVCGATVGQNLIKYLWRNFIGSATFTKDWCITSRHVHKDNHWPWPEVLTQVKIFPPVLQKQQNDIGRNISVAASRVTEESPWSQAQACYAEWVETNKELSSATKMIPITGKFRTTSYRQSSLK